jgi:hypothetical protein
MPADLNRYIGSRKSNPAGGSGNVRQPGAGMQKSQRDMVRRGRATLGTVRRGGARRGKAGLGALWLGLGANGTER